MELYLHTFCIHLSCQFLSSLKNVFKTIQIWMNMERLIGENMEEQLPIYFQILNQFG